MARKLKNYSSALQGVFQSDEYLCSVKSITIAKEESGAAAHVTDPDTGMEAYIMTSLSDRAQVEPQQYLYRYTDGKGIRVKKNIFRQATGEEELRSGLKALFLEKAGE